MGNHHSSFDWFDYKKNYEWLCEWMRWLEWVVLWVKYLYVTKSACAAIQEVEEKNQNNKKWRWWWHDYNGGD